MFRLIDLLYFKNVLSILCKYIVCIDITFFVYSLIGTVQRPGNKQFLSVGDLTACAHNPPHLCAVPVLMPSLEPCPPGLWAEAHSNLHTVNAKDFTKMFTIIQWCIIHSWIKLSVKLSA